MITIFPSLYDSWKWFEGPEDWGGVVELLEREGYETHSKKDAAPLFAPYTLRPGERRHDSSVKELNALVLDFDKATSEELDAVFDGLNARGLAWLAYETFRSRLPVLDKKTQQTDTRERWRVIVPLATPVPAKNWNGFWKAAQADLAPKADPQDKDLSRAYYLPARAPDAPEVCAVCSSVGLCLDPAPYLGPAAAFRDIEPPRQPSTAIILTRDALEAVSKRWKRSKSTVTMDLGFRLEKAMRGEAFAVSGERDAIAFKLATALVTDTPALDCEETAKLFAPALARMEMEDAEGALTVEDFIAKLERAADRHIDICDREADDLAQKRFLRAGRGKYTEEEIAQLSESLGVDPARLEHCWVLQKHGQYYVLQPDGSYFAENKESLMSGARRALAPSPVQLMVATKYGPREISERELLQSHGTAITTVSKSMVIQTPKVNLDAATLTLPACPLLPIEPVYDKEVEHWLRLLGGEQYENLLDWISLVTRLDCPLPVLVLIGHKGGGKTLISHGLARLWTNEGPIKLQKIFSNFNSGLEHCPIVLADEGIEDARGVPQTARLREFVSDQKHHINPKYGGQFDLIGCARVIIAANNHTVLDTPGHLTLSDIAAIAERFFTLKVGADAESYLRAIGGRPKIEGKWLEGGALAAHFAWIQATRPAVIRSRFGIVHDSSDVYSRLLVRSGIRGQICEVIVRCLMRPRASVRLGVTADCVGLSTSQILEVWNEIWPQGKAPPTTVLGTALHELATETLDDGNQVLALIDTKYLRAWVRESGYVSETRLNRAIEEAATAAAAPAIKGVAA